MTHRTLPALALALLVPLAAAAQPLPRFEDYPAGETFRGRPAAVNLASATGARTFRTRLREAAAQGPSFAGRLAVGVWGCGTGCQQGAVVDARTGRVAWIPVQMSFGATYRLGSRLLVVNPPEEVLLYARNAEGVPDWAETRYYVWEGRSFRLVRTLTNAELARMYREATGGR